MQALYDNIDNSEVRISEKELTLLYEIGLNEVPTATDFVVHISGKYEISASGVWYTLKKLKKGGVVDFTEKGEEQRPLSLTDNGMQIMRNRMTSAPKVQKQLAYIRNVGSF